MSLRDQNVVPTPLTAFDRAKQAIDRAEWSREAQEGHLAGIRKAAQTLSAKARARRLGQA